MIRNASVSIASIVLITVTAVAAQAAERVDRTGSRLSTNTTQRTVYRFSEPSEVRRVLSLLEQGETEEAVALAQDYVDSLRSAISVNGAGLASERYFGLNALCAALTKAGRVDEAIEACTRAIEIYPSRWLALNSRGTAYYTGRQFERAMEDYRRALEVVPADDDQAQATVEHNVALAEGRLTENGTRP